MIEPLAQIHSQGRNAVSSVVNEESHPISAPNVSVSMPILTSPIHLHQHEKEDIAYKSGEIDEYEADQEDTEPDLETAAPKELVETLAMVDDDTKSADDTFGALFGCQTATTDAAIFAFRMATSMSLASLVVFLPPMIDEDSEEWPEAAWVYVTAGVVSWQPGPDTAPVFKKLVERIMGTLCGAIVGLLIGFVSIAVAQSVASEGEGNGYLRAQAVFLGLTLSVIVFAGAFLATRTGYRGSYIATLTNLTVGLVVLAFYGTEKDDQDRPPWMHGVYRVVNILLGCAIAGVACFTIRPVPTHKRIVSQVDELSKVTGDSVHKLINTVAELSKAQNGPVDGQKHEVSIPNRLFLPTITEIVRNPDPTSLDEVHDSYITSVDLWKECRQSLQLLAYDPVFRTKFDKAMQKEFREQIRLRLARMFRIHAVVIIVDSLLRGGFHRGGHLNGNAVEALKAIGARIETLLDPSASTQDCSDIARRLVDQDIVQIRQHARMFQMRTSMTLTSFSSSSNGNDDNSSIETADPEATLAGEELWSLLANFDRPYPLAQLEGPSQSSLLFRLVEHIVLKVVRLHHLNKSFRKK